MAKTIMVVDDSFTLRQVLSMNLKKAGYEVVEAEDGRDALNKLSGARVDMIICDVSMPNMDGITFLKELKERPEYAYVPKIMLTTESQQDKKMEGKEAGAKAWIVKPFSSSQMLEAINQVLKRKN